LTTAPVCTPAALIASSARQFAATASRSIVNRPVLMRLVLTTRPMRSRGKLSRSALRWRWGRPTGIGGGMSGVDGMCLRYSCAQAGFPER